MKISVCIIRVSGQTHRIYSTTYLWWNSFTVVFVSPTEGNCWDVVARLREDEQTIHTISFSWLYLKANGLKSQHEFQCQTSTEVIFIIVFPSLIFSKCHHPSINEAFLVLSPHSRMRRYSVLVPVWISTRPLGYWAICIADPLTTLFLFLHTQTAWDGVWVLYALRPPEASFYLLPTSFALCPSDNPSRPERTGEVWRRRRWIEVTTAVQPLWRVLLLVDNQLSLNIPLWCILSGYFQRFLMAPVGLAWH